MFRAVPKEQLFLRNPATAELYFSKSHRQAPQDRPRRTPGRLKGNDNISEIQRALIELDIRGIPLGAPVRVRPVLPIRIPQSIELFFLFWSEAATVLDIVDLIPSGVPLAGEIVDPNGVSDELGHMSNLLKIKRLLVAFDGL
jgi:hypothetical protein